MQQPSPPSSQRPTGPHSHPFSYPQRPLPTQGGPSRRLLLFGGVGALALGLGVAGCSTLGGVDLSELRLASESTSPSRPRLSAAERRRRRLVGGARACLTTLDPLAGDAAGTLLLSAAGVSVESASAVHRSHLEALAAGEAATAGTELFAHTGGAASSVGPDAVAPGAATAEGGAPGAAGPEGAPGPDDTGPDTAGPDTAGPGDQAAADSAAGATGSGSVAGAPAPAGPGVDGVRRARATASAAAAAALASAGEERTADPAAGVELPLLYARIAAARAAQAAALGSDGTLTSTSGVAEAQPVSFGPWPGIVPGIEVVAALQRTLAGQHAAVWVFGVLQVRAGERVEQARRALVRHEAARDAIEAVLVATGNEPVGSEATYATGAVATPQEAWQLAVDVETRLAANQLSIATAALQAWDEAGADWLAAALTVLAGTEQERWSWGGSPAALPGG